MPARSLNRLAYPSILGIVACLSCGPQDGGLGRPEVDVGSVEPVTLAFVNPTTEDVFIDFPDMQPVFSLQKAGSELMTRRGCLPFCGEGCVCAYCSLASRRVRRIPAGETLKVSWEPVHYITNSCNASSECKCAERWPITAGSYRLGIPGFTNAVGGKVDPTNPYVLEGASIGDQSRTCLAASEFYLKSGSFVVEANFTCR